MEDQTQVDYKITRTHYVDILRVSVSRTQSAVYKIRNHFYKCDVKLTETQVLSQCTSGSSNVNLSLCESINLNKRAKQQQQLKKCYEQGDQADVK